MTILIIDVGSSSTRALLFDGAADAVAGATAQRSHQFTFQPPGAAVTDADDLLRLTEECVDEVLRHPAAADIQAVGMATFVSSLVGTDEWGNAVTPLYTYADSRSSDDAESLRDELDIEKTHQRTGCILHNAYYPPRFRWLKRCRPELYERAVYWCDIAAYIYTKWLSKRVSSYSAASWSGLLNRSSLTWDRELLNVLGVSSGSLPILSDYSDAVYNLQREYAERWAALKDVPFFPTVGDGAAANIGSGAVDREHMALTVGTTAALRIVTDENLPKVPPGLFGYRVDEKHHLIGGATFEGGNIFTWLNQTLALPDKDTLEKELSGRIPDSHGLTFLPLLAGERSPGWAVDASGIVKGITLNTSAVDIAQAALEGVALRLSIVADQLSPDDGFVYAGGGAVTASPAWAQIISHALDRPLHILGETEVTARGAAILVLRALGIGGLPDYPPKVERIVEPAPEYARLLYSARERQTLLYRQHFGRESLL